MDAVMVVVAAALAGGVGALGVLVALVTTPVRRFGRAVGGLRHGMDDSARRRRLGIGHPARGDDSLACGGEDPAG